MVFDVELEQQALNSPYSIVRLIRAKNYLSGSGDATLAYAMVIIRTARSKNQEVISVELMPLVEHKQLIESYDFKENSFNISAMIDHRRKMIYLKPTMERFIPGRYRGRGFGGFVFCELYEFLTRASVGYSFAMTELKFSRTATIEDRDIVAKFFESFGFTVEINVDVESIVIREVDISEIKPKFNSKKIEELDFIDYVIGLIHSFRSVEESFNILRESINKELYDGRYGITNSAVIKWIVFSVITFTVLLLFVVF